MGKIYKGSATGRRDLTHEEFIEAWQTSYSVEEVAERLRVSTSAVRNRRNYCASHGVPLKDLRAAKRPVDWNELASLAQTMLPEGEEIYVNGNRKAEREPEPEKPARPPRQYSRR